MKTIQTGRLLLRDLKISDLSEFYDYAKNPNVGPPASWKPHESIDESKRILENLIRSGDVWAIVEKSSSKLIGTVGLSEDSRRQFKNCRMLGYTIGEPWWNMGYCTEASKRVIRYGFEECGLELITINHFPFNEKSKRVIEKCGFVYEGTLRCSTVRYDGKILDTCEYSMTSEEYKKVSDRWDFTE